MTRIYGLILGEPSHYSFCTAEKLIKEFAHHKLHSVGDFILYLGKIFRESIKPPYRFSQILMQMQYIGTDSLMIILLTGFFTGAVFGLQIGGIFKVFNAEGLMGGATGIALATELASLISGFLLTGRVGSAMTAEIATMVVNEQVDALESMGVDPIHYLVVPRVIASLVMIPLLCGFFMFVGVIGSYITGVLIFDVDQGLFIDKLVELVQPNDILLGFRKIFIFAFLIAVFSCRYGIKAGGGAKGVGTATTHSVVHTLIAILTTDFLISYIQLRWFY